MIDSSNSSRRIPALIAHLGFALVDLSMAAGEAMLRLVALLFAFLPGGEHALTGFLGFLFMGNVWWPILHALAAAGVAAGRGWGFGIFLIVARLLFLMVQGRPYFDLAGATFSTGFQLFFGCGLVVLLGVQILARPDARPGWEDLVDGPDDQM